MLPDVRKSLNATLALLVICLLGEAKAMDLLSSGSWATTIDATDLLAGAGSELQSTKESASSQVVLAVSATAGSTDAWRIDVRRADST